MRRRSMFAPPRREAHEKHMASYEQHAWRDAMMIAQFLKDLADEKGVSLASVRRRFDSMELKNKLAFEEKNVDVIATFIQKTDGQRPAYLRKITKGASDDNRTLFLVFCILGAVRAKELLELRDHYRMELAPGRGNRVTIAGAYLFASQVDALFVYDWPSEVFHSLGLYDIGEDD